MTEIGQSFLKERGKQNRGTLTLGGCLYHIAVRYLDFVNFDSIKLPPTLPRIRVWKGKLIRHFSELDKENDGNYGINAIKDFSETCYAAPAILSTKMADDPTMFKAEVERVVGEYMTIQVKDGIFHSFQSHMIDVGKETYSNAQALVLDLLKTIVTESIRKPNSETTLQTQESTHVLDVDQDSQQTKRRRVAQDETRLSSNSSAERNINLETNVIMPNEIL